MANKYKVKAGIHVHMGKKFKKGEVITTDMDLIKLFPEKFENLGKVVEAEKEVETSEDEGAQEEAPKAKTSRASRGR